MAAEEGICNRRRKRCVNTERIGALEALVKELNHRLGNVEETLMGMESMRERMFQLEKSMENALDRIMPRLDALLAGLPTGACCQIAATPCIFPPFPAYISPSPSPPPPSTFKASPSSPVANAVSQPPDAAAPTENAPSTVAGLETCTVCPLKTTSSCVQGAVAEAKGTGSKEKIVTATKAAAQAGSEKQAARSAPEKRKGAPVDNKGSSANNANSASPAPPPPPPEVMEELERELREAAGRGDGFVCQKIMLRGVDAKKRDPITGDTALHMAARGDHLACIMLLLVVARSCVTSTNKQRQTPLMVAAAAGHLASVQLILHQGRASGSIRLGGPKALRQAAADGRDDILQALLDGGVIPQSEVNNSVPSALHVAAANGHAACVRLLIERGADVSLTNSEGHTALHKAAMNGHSECVAALLAAGSNPMDKDTSGWEALHLAARGGHTECVKLVLAYGVEACRQPPLGERVGGSTLGRRTEVEELLMSTAAALGKPASESA